MHKEGLNAVLKYNENPFSDLQHKPLLLNDITEILQMVTEEINS